MDEHEKFLHDARVITPDDKDYLHLAEANQYEILKCTAERVMQPTGYLNPGAILISINGEPERWIPKSMVAVDSEGTLYITEWYFDKKFK